MRVSHREVLGRLVSQYPALRLARVRARLREMMARIAEQRSPSAQMAIMYEISAAVAAARSLVALHATSEALAFVPLPALLAELDEVAASSSGGTVLVVEDDPLHREAIVAVIAAEGYAVVTAANGAEALERLRAERPSLILLDLLMPEMSGWELLALLRQREEWASIPVTVITGAPNPIHVRADAVLAKPIDLAALIDLVRRSCGEAEPPAA